MARLTLRNCTVITCAPQSDVIEDAVLEIEDGKFTRIASGPVAADAIDLGGRYVLPGLWDAHIHLGALVPPYDNGLAEQDPRHHMARCIAKAQDNLRNGITSVRSMGERDGADLLVRDLVNAGTLTGPRVFASGDVRWSRAECGVDNFRRQVRKLVLSGVDQIKLMVTGGIPFPGPVTALTAQRNEVAAAIAEAHAWGKPVAVHAMGDEAVRMAVDCGADTIEHAFACSGEAATIMAKTGVMFCPNLTVTECWNSDSVSCQGLPGWMAENAEQARRGHHDMFAKAVALGVRVCAGVDNLPRYLKDFGIERVGAVPGLIRELELMRGSGLEPMDTLKAATLNAAAAAGAATVLGSLETGKLADFIVVDADPLADPRNLASLVQVWKNGDRLH
jgi:imidazolonepropionase-like amidohydrolase